jgi:hypothetical protein
MAICVLIGLANAVGVVFVAVAIAIFSIVMLLSTWPPEGWVFALFWFFGVPLLLCIAGAVSGRQDDRNRRRSPSPDVK